MSEKLSPTAERLLKVESRLIKTGIPIKNIGDFGPDDPRYHAVTCPVFDPNHARHVLEPILPVGEISKGVEGLKQIHDELIVNDGRKGKTF